MSAAKVAATWKSDLMPALLAALVALAINAWMGLRPWPMLVADLFWGLRENRFSDTFPKRFAASLNINTAVRTGT